MLKAPVSFLNLAARVILSQHHVELPVSKPAAVIKCTTVWSSWNLLVELLDSDLSHAPGTVLTLVEQKASGDRSNF